MADNKLEATKLNTLHTLIDLMCKQNIKTNEVKNSAYPMNGVSNYRTNGFKLPFNTPMNLLTNNQVLLDYLHTQNGMVKKAIDIKVDSAFKMPPKIKTTMISEEDVENLQNLFNEFFNEYKNAVKQTLLYGGAFLVFSFGKTKDELFNFNKNIDEIEEGDIVQLNVFSPWQILDSKQYNIQYVNQLNIASSDNQQNAFFEFLETQKTNVKKIQQNLQEDNIISITNSRYSFTSLSGLLQGAIDESLILKLKNDVFTPYYTGIRLINRWCGFSLLESVDEDLQRYEEALRVMVEIQKVPLIRQVQIEDFAKQSMNQLNKTAIDNVIEKVKNSLRNDGLMITDKDVAVQQLQTSFAGLIEIINFLKNSFIEKIGIPINIWNGEGASGLNATGEDVDRQWNEKIIIEQNKSKSVLHKIVRILAKATYGIDLTDLKIEYSNNYNETEQTKQIKKDAIIKNLADIQNIVGGNLKKSKVLQIVNNANIFEQDIELEDVIENQNPLQNNAESFLQIAND